MHNISVRYVDTSLETYIILLDIKASTKHYYILATGM